MQDTVVAASGFSTMDVWSISSSVVSALLAVIAIWLSIQFFILSEKHSRESTRAAENINESVKRLEILFDRLYSDTFSMMRDTYSDMRRHVWPSTAAEVEEEEVEEDRQSTQIAVLKEELLRSIAHVLERQAKSDVAISEIKSSLEKPVANAIDEAVEAVSTTVQRRDVRNSADLRYVIYRYIRSARRSVTASEIAERFAQRYDFSSILKALEIMKQRRQIDYSDELIGPSTLITVVERSPKPKED